MDREFGPRRWAVALLALIAAVAIGAVAYQAGVSHGMALQVPAVSAPGAPGAPGGAQAAPVPPYAYYPYRYWGPWRFGFFGFFGPLLSIFFFVFLLRMLFWGFGGWAWRRRYWHYDPELGSPRFDEWHRRAHERMRDNSAPASPGA
jgi:hypothetical protein